jgi:hypothetical protein
MLCGAYDQISQWKCRYYAGHLGRHNFARVDHDTALERELRRELDQMTMALGQALDLFDSSWCPAHGHSPTTEAFDRATKLRQRIDPSFTRDRYP